MTLEMPKFNIVMSYIDFDIDFNSSLSSFLIIITKKNIVPARVKIN